MGTLTADCPRLDDHCPHKLATSCRLTSTPNCCACADERAHSSTYRVYIDGVGFVQRGTRWQSYCWFCKEFWNNRLAATDPPLEISQTRIPEIPNQTEFLQRWFEYHQGYRTATYADGMERRIAVIGEPLQNVSPGFLPRTLDELRVRRANNAQRPANRFGRRRLSSEENRPQEPQQSIDDALDSLMEAASDDETDRAASDVQAEPAELHSNESSHQEVDTAPTRAEARTQRMRERFARVFGTREEIEQDDYESPLTTMYTRAWQRHQQAEERRASGDTVAPPLDSLSVAERRDVEQQILWGVVQDSQHEILASARDDPSADEHARLLRDLESQVTHNEVTRRQFSQSIDRDLSTLLARLGPNAVVERDQARQLENIRREMDLLALGSASTATSTTSSLPTTRVAPSASMTTTTAAPSSGPRSASASRSASTTSRSAELQGHLERINEELGLIRAATDAVTGGRLASLARLGLFGQPELDMDKQNRPPPLEDSDMTKMLSCRVCYSQLADIAVLPCGHMAMCQWCADTIIPVKHSHVPIRPSKCPVCRKPAKQRFKIHM